MSCLINKEIIIPINTTILLVETFLPNVVSGEKQRVRLRTTPHTVIIKAVQEGDVWATIACNRGNVEWIKITQGSYVSSTNSFEIVRGVSGSYDSTIGEVLDLTKPGDIAISFGKYVPPKILQEIYNNLGDYSQVSDNYIKSEAPKATTTTSGVIEVAYRGQDLASNIASKAITTDSPALQKLYQSVFGSSTTAFNTQILNIAETNKAGALMFLLSFFAENTEALANLTDVLLKLNHPTAKANFIDFLEKIKTQDKYINLKDVLN